MRKGKKMQKLRDNYYKLQLSFVRNRENCRTASGVLSLWRMSSSFCVVNCTFYVVISSFYVVNCTNYVVK